MQFILWSFICGAMGAAILSRIKFLGIGIRVLMGGISFYLGALSVITVLLIILTATIS